jgi:hypothetical protein
VSKSLHYSHLCLGLPSGHMPRSFPIKIGHAHTARYQFYFNENLHASSEIQSESLVSRWSNMLIQWGALKSAEELQNTLTASQFKANMIFMPLVQSFGNLLQWHYVYIFFWHKWGQLWSFHHPYHGCRVKGWCVQLNKILSNSESISASFIITHKHFQEWNESLVYCQ